MSLTGPVPCTSNAFFFASLLLDFLYLLSSDKSDSPNYESDDDGSGSGSSGRYSFTAFSLRFDKYVGCVSGMGSGVFVPTVVEYKCDIFMFVVFVPIGVKSKGGRDPSKLFGTKIPCSLSKF